jgi:hypothetical protein
MFKSLSARQNVLNILRPFGYDLMVRGGVESRHAAYAREPENPEGDS